LSFSPEGQLLLWNRWTMRKKIFDEPFERLYRINGCSNSEWNNLVYTSERQSQYEIWNKTIHWKHNVIGKCTCLIILHFWNRFYDRVNSLNRMIYVVYYFKIVIRIGILKQLCHERNIRTLRIRTYHSY